MTQLKDLGGVAKLHRGASELPLKKKKGLAKENGTNPEACSMLEH